MDEWFLVWLFFYLTSSSPNASHFGDLTITLTDHDGQFLLIEAAHLLPSWLSPETSHNSVFLRQGRLHILPPASILRKKYGITNCPHPLTGLLPVCFLFAGALL